MSKRVEPRGDVSNQFLRSSRYYDHARNSLRNTVQGLDGKDGAPKRKGKKSGPGGKGGPAGNRESGRTPSGQKRGSGPRSTSAASALMTLAAMGAATRIVDAQLANVSKATAKYTPYMQDPAGTALGATAATSDVAQNVSDFITANVATSSYDAATGRLNFTHQGVDFIIDGYQEGATAGVLVIDRLYEDPQCLNLYNRTNGCSISIQATQAGRNLRIDEIEDVFGLSRLQVELPPEVSMPSAESGVVSRKFVLNEDSDLAVGSQKPFIAYVDDYNAVIDRARNTIAVKTGEGDYIMPNNLPVVVDGNFEYHYGRALGANNSLSRWVELDKTSASNPIMTANVDDPGADVTLTRLSNVRGRCGFAPATISSWSNSAASRHFRMVAPIETMSPQYFELRVVPGEIQYTVRNPQGQYLQILGDPLSFNENGRIFSKPMALSNIFDVSNANVIAGSDGEQYIAARYQRSGDDQQRMRIFKVSDLALEGDISATSDFATSSGLARQANNDFTSYASPDGSRAYEFIGVGSGYLEFPASGAAPTHISSLPASYSLSPVTDQQFTLRNGYGLTGSTSSARISSPGALNLRMNPDVGDTNVNEINRNDLVTLREDVTADLNPGNSTVISYANEESLTSTINFKVPTIAEAQTANIQWKVFDREEILPTSLAGAAGNATFVVNGQVIDPTTFDSDSLDGDRYFVAGNLEGSNSISVVDSTLDQGLQAARRTNVNAVERVTTTSTTGERTTTVTSTTTDPTTLTTTTTVSSTSTSLTTGTSTTSTTILSSTLTSSSTVSSTLTTPTGTTFTFTSVTTPTITSTGTSTTVSATDTSITTTPTSTTVSTTGAPSMTFTPTRAPSIAPTTNHPTLGVPPSRSPSQNPTVTIVTSGPTEIGRIPTGSPIAIDPTPPAPPTQGPTPTAAPNGGGGDDSNKGGSANWDWRYLLILLAPVAVGVGYVIKKRWERNRHAGRVTPDVGDNRYVSGVYAGPNPGPANAPANVGDFAQHEGAGNRGGDAASSESSVESVDLFLPGGVDSVNEARYGGGASGTAASTLNDGAAQLLEERSPNPPGFRRSIATSSLPVQVVPPRPTQLPQLRVPAASSSVSGSPDGVPKRPNAETVIKVLNERGTGDGR